jgi:hypothetical protein
MASLLIRKTNLSTHLILTCLTEFVPVLLGKVTSRLLKVSGMAF